MITIKKISLYHLSIPLKTPMVTSKKTLYSKECLLLKFYSKDNLNTWSECVSLSDDYYLPETLSISKKELIEILIPSTLNKNIKSPDAFSDDLHSISTRNMAIASLEMGVWNLFALTNKCYLGTLLGPIKAKVTAGVALSLGEDENKFIVQLESALENNYRRIKFKLSPKTDKRLLSLINTMDKKYDLSQFELTLDANGAYTQSELSDLIALCKPPISMIEQPFDKRDIKSTQALRNHIKIPISLDESIETLEDLKLAISHKVATHITLKTGKLGGLTQTLKFIEICQKEDIDICIGGMFETDIGKAYNLALSSLKDITQTGDLSDSYSYFDSCLVEPPLQKNKDGFFTVPSQKIGLGVSIKEDCIDKFTKERIDIT
jgi:o-succinylbenzoate synthase